MPVLFRVHITGLHFMVSSLKFFTVYVVQHSLRTKASVFITKCDIPGEVLNTFRLSILTLELHRLHLDTRANNQVQKFISNNCQLL